MKCSNCGTSNRVFHRTMDNVILCVDCKREKDRLETLKILKEIKEKETDGKPGSSSKR